ncbi:MAG: DUF924 domain-containing protein [Gammaproteobacteria bacterium]|nr:DUF924 domain-containing protein [Gammaproteobacteria bacterium]
MLFSAVKPPLATPQAVLNYWFSDAAKPYWFALTPEVDQEIRQRFESTWQAASRHELDHWCETAEGCLALIIVLDQFPLNMYRGQELSFSTEAQARNVAKKAIEKGFESQIAKDQLAFLFLPFMHSESMADQEVSVQLFFNANLDDNLPFAQHHRDIVAQFGRFPHRNAILGRTSTPAEIAYLASPEGFKGGLYEKTEE